MSDDADRDEEERPEDRRLAEVVALRALDGGGDHEHDEPDDRQGDGDQHQHQRGDAEPVAGGRRDDGRGGQRGGPS